VGFCGVKSGLGKDNCQAQSALNCASVSPVAFSILSISIPTDLMEASIEINSYKLWRRAVAELERTLKMLRRQKVEVENIDCDRFL
jgi:hypothetical protein